MSLRLLSVLIVGSALLPAAVGCAVRAQDNGAGKKRGAAERALDSRVVSVAMFKNGLALVERRLKPPGPGTYRVEDIPRPIHGTFWFYGSADVSARVVMRELEVDAQPQDVDLQRDLAGRRVTIHLREMAAPTVGVVRRFAPPEEPPVDLRSLSSHRSARQDGGRFLVLETEDGLSYIDRSQIAHLQVVGGQDKVVRRRPVLLLEVPRQNGAPAPITVRYLAQGIAWAPSYLIELVDGKKLRVRQKAVIRNEQSDLEDAELHLISGYPNIRFQHVTSPLAPETNWSQFFAQINRRMDFRAGQSALSNNIISQQVAAPSSSLSRSTVATPSGEGVDLHYESVGRRNLERGESLSVSVAAGVADYDRIVEWIVPDTRGANGRHIQEYQRRSNPEKYKDSAWDALRFKNPLAMPMTTGPATIVRDGRFNGQTLSYWVSRGEETTLHVTKALSLRTLASEHEVPGKRNVVYIGGNDYREVNVKGQLTISNHRNEVVEMVIRRRFSGELESADGEPKKSLREEGVYSVNRRNELLWTVRIKPGETQVLNYQYKVLVDN